MSKPKANFSWSGKAKAGRPRQDGDRYPSGKLKPRKPNERTLEMRRSVGVIDIGQAFSPIQVAARQGWLSEEDCRTAALLAAIYSQAGIGRPVAGSASVTETPEPTEVSRDFWYFSTLPSKEVAEIWNAVFNFAGQNTTQQERAERSTKQWKVANAAMTPPQRQEVYNVCILDSFPQWVIHRAAGRMDTSWENKRTLLIEGLGAARRALIGMSEEVGASAPMEAASIVETAAPAPDRPVEHSRGFRRVSYVSQEGEALYEAEWIRREKRA